MPLVAMLMAMLLQQSVVLWLDRPVIDWNRGHISSLPAAVAPAATANRCLELVRRPSNAFEQAVTREGWALYGPVQRQGGTVVLLAMSFADGMCRPDGYQAFVSVNGTFAGTLAPAPMRARSDGALSTIRLVSETRIVTEFARYAATDALCCPSRVSTVTYRVDRGAAPNVIATDVSTRPTPRN